MGHTLQNKRVSFPRRLYIPAEINMLLHEDSGGGGGEETSWQQMEADSQLFAFALFEKETRD